MHLKKLLKNLKNNQLILNLWWKSIKNADTNIYPVDTAIIQSSDVWKSSGHLEEFTDPMVECKNCNKRLRSDSEEITECCDNQELTEPKQFNLMFETYSGYFGESVIQRHFAEFWCCHGQIFWYFYRRSG